MIPLAGAIFSKDDLGNMLEGLGVKKTKENKTALLRQLICSCQSSGQYVSYSEIHYALIATLCATRTMKDRPLAINIARKVAKQYKHKNKEFDKKKFDAVCVHATGGVDFDIDPESLLEDMVNIQKLTRKQKQAVDATSVVYLSTDKETPKAQTSAAQTGTTEKKKD